jgi:hypothetical protein
MKVPEFIEWLKTQNQDAIVKVYDTCDERLIEFNADSWLHCEYNNCGKTYLYIGE